MCQFVLRLSRGGHGGPYLLRKVPHEKTVAVGLIRPKGLQSSVSKTTLRLSGKEANRIQLFDTNSSAIAQVEKTVKAYSRISRVGQEVSRLHRNSGNITVNSQRIPPFSTRQEALYTSDQTSSWSRPLAILRSASLVVLATNPPCSSVAQWLVDLSTSRPITLTARAYW